jgi:hypothetical protein
MTATIVSLLLLTSLPGGDLPAAKIPVIHSTDLFHPHDDPDDHYDLACLFAIPEFDIQGIVLDMGATQALRSGAPAVEQMMRITGRRAPYAIGLSQRLRTGDDRALEEPAKFQGAVQLILSILRKSPEPVTIFTAGSCRDVAAAFNREPELLKRKVKAVYCNIGRGPNESQNECNVGYDPLAFFRLFESGLPIYWCPCFGQDGYQTFYTADQATVVGGCTPAVRNYFVYCLTRSPADPIAFLDSGPYPLPQGPRRMWCTAPMFHAAGRKIYQRGSADFVALSAAAAAQAGVAHQLSDPFQFVPIRAEIRHPAIAAGTPRSHANPGQMLAVWQGRRSDLPTAISAEAGSRRDCCVRVFGLDPQRPIKNIILTSPNQGRWEYLKTARWWRVTYEREQGPLDCHFAFYVPGEHKIEVVFADGGSQSASFVVPGSSGLELHVDLRPAQPNAFVFRSIDARYPQILASCLKNLLAELGR